MSRFLVLIFVAACTSIAPLPEAPDGAESISPFLEEGGQPADFAGVDIAKSPSDAAEPITPADLATVDLAQAPADLAAPCGGAGQACCAPRACDAGLECMRSETDGRIACIQATMPAGCGSYNQSTCSSGGQAWCGYNVTLACFLTGGPCKPCAS